MDPVSSDGRPFRLLAVCTGNVCRSPAVQSRLAAALTPGEDVEVSSAGLQAHVGAPVAPDMALVLRTPMPGFAARQVSTELLAEADLVLGMTRAHRSSLVTASPSGVRKTFTLAEFAELAVLARDAGALPEGGSAGRRLAAVVAVAHRFRGRRTPGPHEDVHDPYGRQLRDHARTLAQIDRILSELVPVVSS